MDHFIDIGLIFIGASIIFVPLFHRLGFGSVLGYLLAGMAVGPYGLKLIRDLDSVMHVSEIGVVMLLFIIGLEIQPRRLWEMRKDLIGLGELQIIVSTLLFTCIGLLAKLTFVQSLALGFGLSLSSTAFALQTLADKNTFSTTFGKGSFSILLMQDLMAIPALAILPMLSDNKTTESGPLWPVPVFIISLFAISRFLIRPFFRLIAKTKSREIFTTTALFIVLGVASVMLKLGMSAALGTFIAGVLLADSEYRHELEANLDPFKSLFLGLFFMGIGMTVSLNLIVEHPFFIFGLALSYLFLKGLIIFAIGRTLCMNTYNAKMMSLTIAQGGEFAFVIFGIAATFLRVDSYTISVLTAVVTLSMALNPLISKIDEWWTSRKLVTVEPTYDEIKNESPEIIVAGFGRFGQMFGRIFRAQRIPFVAIDHDADQIDLLRKFGNKVYFGDVSRMDLLEMAGIEKAKFFVLAIDDIEVSKKVAQMIGEKYPHIKIFARARNRGHVFDLMDLNVAHIRRETFDSSVALVKELLIEMGHPPERAQTITDRFKIHDELLMKEQYKVRDDDKMFVSAVEQGAAQLAQVLDDEANQSYIELK